MNKKIIAYVLIGLGILDLIIWAANGFTFGWLELIVGVNVLSKYGAWLMIFYGFWMFKKEKAKEQSEVDEISDLTEGEHVVFKNLGGKTIITLTNKKIIFRAFSLDDSFVKAHNDIVFESKATIEYASIESVTPVKTKDTAKNKLAGALNLEFGIQLKMKDGTIKNLPSSKSELLCAHINKFL
jgi:hypothetical protein